MPLKRMQICNVNCSLRWIGFSFGTSSMLAQPIAATIAAMMQVEVKEPLLEVRSAAVTIGAMNSVIAVPSVPQPYRRSA